MAEQHRVLRPFQGDRPYATGELVDTTGWRWTGHLVERRYLAPAPPAEQPAGAPARPSRRVPPKEA